MKRRNQRMFGAILGTLQRFRWVRSAVFRVCACSGGSLGHPAALTWSAHAWGVSLALQRLSLSGLSRVFGVMPKERRRKGTRWQAGWKGWDG